MTSRSVEEVGSTLLRAKLSVDELLPLSQEIVFDANFSGTDLRLLELEKEIMDSIQVGDKLVIRGEEEDFAVLCTKETTFELKQVETSNSLLIFKELTFPEDMSKLENQSFEEEKESSCSQVMGDVLRNMDGKNQFIGQRSILHISHTYYEANKIRPNLGRLPQVLRPSSYKGSSEENELLENNCIFYTLEMLLDTIPASLKEIDDHIESKLRSFRSDGKIRLVDDDYLFRVLSHVLDCVEGYSWERNEVKKDVVIGELNGLHPEFILEKVFDWFFFPQSQETDERINRAERLYSMNEYEINRFFGTIILKSGRRFNLEDFVLAWSESVPKGLTVNLNQLHGLAVTDVENVPQLIWYFPEDSLPESIRDRFVVLFGTKAKWKQDDIIPYIQNVSGSSQSASALLTKHSRVHTVNGIKHYCSKHSK